ncbi:hypothetical protein PFISCL1PPCAC_76, partial [Pristionchus fissidentatus]
TRGPLSHAMGCTVTKRRPPVADGKLAPSIKSDTNSNPLDSNSSKNSKRKVEAGPKLDPAPKLEPSASKTDISKLVTEQGTKVDETSDKKKTLEEKSAMIPSQENSVDNGKTPIQTPHAAADQKLQPPKPDNGEYINFNDLDDYSEDDDKKEGEKKEGEKKEEKKKKEGKKEKTVEDKEKKE